MKFSFLIKSIIKDFIESSKINSFISIFLIFLIVITVVCGKFFFIPVSNQFKDVGLTAVSILFSFQLFLFQSTNFDSMKSALNSMGKKQLNKYQVTLITNFRIILLYILGSIIFFSNNYIACSIIFVLTFKLIFLMMYSTVLFNISNLKKANKIPQYHISELMECEVKSYDDFDEE